MFNTVHSFYEYVVGEDIMHNVSTKFRLKSIMDLFVLIVLQLCNGNKKEKTALGYFDSYISF